MLSKSWHFVSLLAIILATAQSGWSAPVGEQQSYFESFTDTLSSWANTVIPFTHPYVKPIATSINNWFYPELTGNSHLNAITAFPHSETGQSKRRPNPISQARFQEAVTSQKWDQIQSLPLKDIDVGDALSAAARKKQYDAMNHMLYRGSHSIENVLAAKNSLPKSYEKMYELDYFIKRDIGDCIDNNEISKLRSLLNDNKITLQDVLQVTAEKGNLVVLKDFLQEYATNLDQNVLLYLIDDFIKLNNGFKATQLLIQMGGFENKNFELALVSAIEHHNEEATEQIHNLITSTRPINVMKMIAAATNRKLIPNDTLSINVLEYIYAKNKPVSPEDTKQILYYLVAIGDASAFNWAFKHFENSQNFDPNTALKLIKEKMKANEAQTLAGSNINKSADYLILIKKLQTIKEAREK